MTQIPAPTFITRHERFRKQQIKLLSEKDNILYQDFGKKSAKISQNYDKKTFRGYRPTKSLFIFNMCLTDKMFCKKSFVTVVLRGLNLQSCSEK